jgi:arsenate reductase-like glutaredoxin family protein
VVREHLKTQTHDKRIKRKTEWSEPPIKRKEDFIMSYLSDLLGTAYKEGMTEEEISAALETANSGSEAEVNRLKAALSKANSEAADYKKQLRTKQTDDEANAAAQKEEHDKLAQENTELKRSIALSEKKAKLLAMGYDETLATETATAMVDGDMDKVMANQSKYLEVQKKNIQADHMKKTPRPAGGSEETGGVDYAQKISEAQAGGNLAAVAYYTRLQAQEAAEQTTEN